MHLNCGIQRRIHMPKGIGNKNRCIYSLSSTKYQENGPFLGKNNNFIHKNRLNDNFLIKSRVANAFLYENKRHNSTMHENVSFGNKTVPKAIKEKLVAKVFTSVAEQYDLMNDLMSLGIHRLWKDEFIESINFPYLHQEDIKDISISEYYSVLDLAGGTGDIAFRLIDRAVEQVAKQPYISQYSNTINHSYTINNNTTNNPLIYKGIDFTICDINHDMLKIGQQRAVERGIPLRPIIEGYPNNNTLHNDTNNNDHTDASSMYNNVPKILRKDQDFGYIDNIGIRWVRGNGECLPFPSNTFDIITIAFGLRNFTNISQGLSEAYRVLKPGGRFLCLEFSKVQNFAFQQIYDLYSFSVLPLLGHYVANDAKSYQYLAESIRKFPDQEALAHLMYTHGFKHIHHKNMLNGIVAIHSGFKL